ncbi:hypothetical protein BV898_03297 [Hypsibius exemplaris]|uniref:Uncharacterized protein n=1 Tax=Hypsibius exemplaris TaxID=2072580 RepID=A0A1W0X5U0_HYPEX|nr:hypothetical protein BV898_03297 [Hypsibius exemplaris]
MMACYNLAGMILAGLLALLALTPAGSAVELPDDDAICKLSPTSEELINLENVEFNSRSNIARRCYHVGSSVVKLQCDFEQQQFRVTVNATALSDSTSIIDRPRGSKSAAKASGRFAADGGCEHAVWTEDNLVERVIGFREEREQLDGSRAEPRLVIENGLVYYRTEVVLAEALYGVDGSCGTVSLHDTTVSLSCCADPLPAEILQVEAPLIGECKIDDCINSNLQCNCDISNNIMNITLNTIGGIGAPPANIDYQLNSLIIRLANQSDHPAVSIYPSSEAHGLQQCAPQHYATNQLTFSGAEDERLAVTCGIKYCAKEPSAVTPNTPLCTQAAVPPPRVCAA